MEKPGELVGCQGFFAMKRIPTAVFAIVALAGYLSSSRADEPIKMPRTIATPPQYFEILPPLQGTAQYLPPTVATRQDRYAPWQNWGVSKTGYPVLRVVMFPDGESRWVYDGKNYPWLTTHMRYVVPFMISL
jgi:hypothetical protein